jgi:hypothetical protein
MTALQKALMATALSALTFLPSASFTQAGNASAWGQAAAVPATIGLSQSPGLSPVAWGGAGGSRELCIRKFAGQCIFNECQEFTGDEREACELACVDFADALCPGEPVSY